MLPETKKRQRELDPSDTSDKCRLACVDKHARLAPDLALPDALLLRLVDPLVAGDEREEVVLGVPGQGHALGYHAREDLPEFLDVRPDQPLHARVDGVRPRPVHEHVDAWVEGGEGPGQYPEGLLRLRLPGGAEGEQADHVHCQILAARRHVDGLTLPTGAQEFLEEDVDLGYHGRLKVAHGALGYGLPDDPAPAPVICLIQGSKDARGASKTGKCIDGSLCDSGIQVYV